MSGGSSGRSASCASSSACTSTSSALSTSTRNNLSTDARNDDCDSLYGMKPLQVAFVWHMHQPYYSGDSTTTYLLPWLRLRSPTSYLKIPALLDASPKIHATFNLVPSLLAHSNAYGT